MTKDQGWTLVARFSNADYDNWKPFGHVFGGHQNSQHSHSWWQYDKEDTEGKGRTTNPSDNHDMISPAFWLVSGSELMITRNDEPHTALLKTTDDCLGGETFRSRVALGDLRNWNRYHCHRDSCHVEYGGKYQETAGFEQANKCETCARGVHGECTNEFQNGAKIGFWCYYKHRNWAAMMIGGGGDECSGADHGIVIKDKDKRNEFGNKAEDQSPTVQYSLNLWVR